MQEAGLGDSMVLRMEFERDGVANVGGDVRRVVAQFTICTNSNLMVNRVRSGSRS